MDASQQITNQIKALGGWRGKTVERLRRLIHDAAPALAEDWKWNTAVWTHNGNVVAVGAFQDHVKMNFFKGASLEDPAGLFNAGLEAKASRSIDIAEGDRLDEAALKDLIRAAAALDGSGAKNKPAAARSRTRPKASRS